MSIIYVMQELWKCWIIEESVSGRRKSWDWRRRIKFFVNDFMWKDTGPATAVKDELYCHTKM